MTKNHFLVGLLLIVTTYTQSFSQNNSTHQTMTNQGVTIVKVKAPWYGFDFLIKSKFKGAIPQYQKAKGLKFKAFSISENEQGKNFGGIYLWETQQNAQEWFNPKWFARVEAERGVKPMVVQYKVLEALANKTPQNQDACVAVHCQTLDSATTQRLMSLQQGTFRAYKVEDNEGKMSLILFFDSKDNAQKVIATEKLSNIDWFKVPVLLNNQP